MSPLPSDPPAMSPENAAAPRRRGLLGKILIGLVVVLAVLAVIVQMQPDLFRVERSVTVNAPAAAVFPHVNNLKLSNAWSPFDDADPNIQMVYEGPEEGVGAIMKWTGNDDVGEGSMQVVESRAPEYMKAKLEFVRPMVAENDVEYVLAPEGEQTKVTWIMTGEQNFLSKAMCLVMDMDAMIGAEFDKGLGQLKSIVEKPAG